MSASPSDALAALLELVSDAARKGAEQAIMSQHGRPAHEAPGPLIDKKALAHALGVSPATIDRLCRGGCIPFVRVGDVRRFDLVAVRAVLDEGRTTMPPSRATKQGRLNGVRLLSRR